MLKLKGMSKNYDSKYSGLDNLTTRQIETLAYRSGLKIKIKQYSDGYYLMLGNGVAGSRIYQGYYKKNENYPSSIYEE